jgi:hypothetical protein
MIVQILIYVLAVDLLVLVLATLVIAHRALARLRCRARFGRFWSWAWLRWLRGRAGLRGFRSGAWFGVALLRCRARLRALTVRTGDAKGETDSDEQRGANLRQSM